MGNKTLRHSVFMKRALEIAKDMLAHGYLPVGTVLVKGNKIIADNAFVKGDKNPLQRLDHAEVVALRRLFQKEGDTNVDDVTLYCTFEPCLMCYSTAIIAGITKIVFAYEDVMGGCTNINHAALKPFYSEITMNITPAVCRNESLALFKKYFENPDNAYAGTLLESYTLAATS
jgi:tRNA(adenine34) deaminase